MVCPAKKESIHKYISLNTKEFFLLFHFWFWQQFSARAHLREKQKRNAGNVLNSAWAIHWKKQLNGQLFGDDIVFL
jgi:hypothetical protein